MYQTKGREKEVEVCVCVWWGRKEVKVDMIHSTREVGQGMVGGLTKQPL
jgi:hypothetical protein